MANLVCKCLNVEEPEIAAAIRAGATTIEAIGARCEAGTGCTACHAALHGLLEEAHEARARARAGAGAPQLSLFPDG